MKNATSEGQDQAAMEEVEEVVVGNEESGQASSSSTTDAAATTRDNVEDNDDDQVDEVGGNDTENDERPHTTSNSNIQAARLNHQSSLRLAPTASSAADYERVANHSNPLPRAYSNDLSNINPALTEDEREEGEDDEADGGEEEDRDNQGHELPPINRSRSRQRSQRSIVARMSIQENRRAAGDWFEIRHNDSTISNFALHILIAVVIMVVLLLMADIVEALFTIPRKHAGGGSGFGMMRRRNRKKR